MSEVLITPIEPDQRRENGLLIVDLVSYESHVDFAVVVRQVVCVPAGEIAGNHKHPRIETFLTFDSGAEFHWIDANGDHQAENMASDNGDLRLFTVRPHVPHAIRNSSDHNITLIELADAQQHDVVPFSVIQ